MKVAVIGASGPSGRESVKQALDREWDVVAVVRSPEKMADVQHQKLQVKQTDVLSVESMESALEGCDAVISCLGAPASQMLWWKTVSLYSESAPVIVEAMRRCGVKRLVVMSSWCTVYKPEHPKLVEWILKPLFLGRHLADMARMEDYLSNDCGDIEYTAVRPPGLTDEPISERPFVAEEGQHVPKASNQIPRANIAKYMLDCVETGQDIGKFIAVGLLG